MWTHELQPTFKKENIILKKYGSIHRKCMSVKELEAVGIPKHYLTKTIPGNPALFEKPLVIFPRDDNIVFRYSERTYKTSLEFFVKSKYIEN